MQAILSYEQSPPLAAPVRFFLTAPIFGVLAGLLILWRGPDVFVSRWVPETLALTHLMTTGFMLQVMLGALLQILPVIAGANMRSPLRVAGTVHASLTLAALCLAAAFLFFSPHLFKISALFFAVGAGVFVVAAALSLRGVPSTSATVLMPNVSCSWVCLYRLFSTTSGTSPRLSSITRRMPDLSDSS